MAVDTAFGLAVASVEPLGGDVHRTDALTTTDGRRFALKRAADRTSLEEQDDRVNPRSKSGV